MIQELLERIRIHPSFQKCVHLFRQLKSGCFEPQIASRRGSQQEAEVDVDEISLRLRATDEQYIVVDHEVPVVAILHP